MKRKNLDKLANHLLALPKNYQHFCMRNFCEILEEEEDENSVRNFSFPSPASNFVVNLQSCDTIACALGHGIAAGIKNKLGYESWWAYGDEYFIDSDKEKSKWEWCFDSGWAERDNTPQGAGKRIKWLLENGLPHNWRKQMSGDAELCYTGEEV